MLANEKEALGCYISGHPLEQYHQEIRRYATKTLAQIQETGEGERVTVVGVAAAVVDRMTKTGKRMAIVTLEDMTGSVRMVCFSGGRSGQAGYDQWESDLKADDPLVITGAVTINNREEENPVREIKAEEITRLSELRRKKTRNVAFKLPADKVTAERLTSLKLVLVKHAGETPREPRGVGSRRGRGHHPAGGAAGSADGCADPRCESAVRGTGLRAAVISLSDIEAARERIRGAVRLTPCIPSESLSKQLGCEVYLKLENLQRTGSFKERGASTGSFPSRPRSASAG